MRQAIERFFRLGELGTDIRTEIVAGITTFVTMAYIIVVNPKILEAAGIPVGPSMVATILSAVFGTMAMGLYAKRPFVIAPYMGENAFVAFTVVKVMGHSWQTALGAVFVGGVLFVIITLLRVRSWFVGAIPENLKVAFTVGIGLFLAFVGLNETGLVTLGVPGAPVRIGDLSDTGAQLAVGCFFLMGVLMIYRVRAAILAAIVATTVLAFALGAAKMPQACVGLPPSLGPVFLELDVAGALSWGFFSVILTMLVMDFVDTMGTLIGVAYNAGMLDEDGNFPEIEKPMLCDALATVVGAALGTTTTGTFIESATGIESGGRSGLTAVVAALLFLGCLFFAPFVTAVPACAYGPALILVGMLMLRSVQNLDFSDLTELIPVFCVIALMPFTYNLGMGMTAGFVSYPLVKVAAGRWREVSAGLWALAAVSVLFFCFYPYQK